MTGQKERELLKTVNALAEHVQNLRYAIILLGKSVRRMEVMQGLSEPPEEWNITTERLVTIAETKGMSMDQAREELIKNFGVLDEGSNNG